MKASVMAWLVRLFVCLLANMKCFILSDNLIYLDEHMTSIFSLRNLGIFLVLGRYIFSK